MFSTTTLAGASSFLMRAMVIVALGGLAHSLTEAQNGAGIESTATGGRHAIQGRIYFPSGRRSDARVKVKLENYGAGELSVLSDSNGSFGFTGLLAGNYTVVIEGGDDYETV